MPRVVRHLGAESGCGRLASPPHRMRGAGRGAAQEPCRRGGPLHHDGETIDFSLTGAPSRVGPQRPRPARTTPPPPPPQPRRARNRRPARTRRSAASSPPSPRTRRGWWGCVDGGRFPLARPPPPPTAPPPPLRSSPSFPATDRFPSVRGVRLRGARPRPLVDAGADRGARPYDRGTHRSALPPPASPRRHAARVEARPRLSSDTPVALLPLPSPPRAVGPAARVPLPEGAAPHLPFPPALSLPFFRPPLLPYRSLPPAPPFPLPPSPLSPAAPPAATVARWPTMRLAA